jgi:hypothetical protein
MKKRKTPQAVTTMILTLITIFFWAGFEVYRSFTTKPIPPVPAEILNPLDPTLDTASLNSLNQRLFLNENEIGNSVASGAAVFATLPPEVTPTGSPSATPVSTPSATPLVTATPSATP